MRTYDTAEWTVSELVAAKRGRTVSVLLPALDEEETVGGVVASILPHVDAGLVDELILVDSGSADATCARAAAAGARVVSAAEIAIGPGPEGADASPGEACGETPPGPRRTTTHELRPGAEHDFAPRRGKGEALWRGLAVARGDVVAFVDTDLHDPSPDFVPGVVGPLLLDPDVCLVKAFYQRPLRTADGVLDPFGGGRVNELVARPLLAALAPELADLRQPLSGEYALRRDVARALPFAARYGVEIGLVLDVAARWGAGAIAQVGLGIREHRHRPLADLAVTSRQVLEAALTRLGVPVADPVLPEDRPPLESLSGGPSEPVESGNRPISST